MKSIIRGAEVFNTYTKTFERKEIIFDERMILEVKDTLSEDDLFEAVVNQAAADIVEQIKQSLVPQRNRAGLVGTHMEAAVPVGLQRGDGHVGLDCGLHTHIIGGVGIHTDGKRGAMLLYAADRDDDGVGLFKPLFHLHPGHIKNTVFAVLFVFASGIHYSYLHMID